MFSNFLRNYFIFALILSAKKDIANGMGRNAPKEWADEKAYDFLRCGLFLESENDKNQSQNAKGFHYGAGRLFNKIMGGQNVEEGTSPWTAAIFRQKTDKAVYICSATLISKRHVVTAAHCMFGGNANKICFGETFKSANEAKTEEMCRQPKGFLSVQQIRQQISVYIGSVCLSDHNNPPCESSKTQRKFRRHGISVFFTCLPLSDDLIVLELDLAVPEALANHICLPFMHNLQDDFYWRQMLAKGNGTRPKGTVRVTGWGSAPDKQKNGLYGTAYSKLQMLEMPNIWTREQCVKKKAQLTEKQDDGLGFSEDKLCTMEAKSRDTCLGDSGGGLVGNFEDGKGRRRWFLLGVLSSGGDCSQLRYGSVPPLIQEFTNITFHKKSIEIIVKRDGNSEENYSKTKAEETTTTKRAKAQKGEDQAEPMWGNCQ